MRVSCIICDNYLENFIMIKLYGFGKNLGLLDASPFVVKVHTFLKVAELDYETIASPHNIGKSPKGKLPFITDDDKTVSDSQDIIEYLSESYQVNLDKTLTEEQRATAYLLTKSLDENLYWCLVWSRWQEENTWKIVKNSFFKGLPFPISAIIPKILRKKVIKSLKAQGTGRHSEKEIIEIANKSFQALSALLGDKDYFFGPNITGFDITAYAFIASFTQAELENKINNIAKSYKNLVSYCDRINNIYF